jgi:hypothetical protein
MKKNRLIIILAIVLAVIAALLAITGSKGTIKPALKDFAVDDTSNVVKIFMTDKNNLNILLERQSQGYWELNGHYRAQQESVDLLLKTMLNLAVMQPVSEAAHNTVIKVMASSAVKVEIYQKVFRINLFKHIRLFPHVKRTKTYYVGHVTQNNIGTYMLMEHSSTPFIVYIPGFRGFVQSRYSTIEKDWRDHAVFSDRINNIQSVTVQFVEHPERSFQVVNHDDVHFALVSLIGDKEIPDFDTMKVVNFLVSFANIRCEAFLNDLPQEERDTITARYPFHIITLTKKSGETVVVKTFYKPLLPGQFDSQGHPLKMDLDRFYALINEDKDFVLVQFFVFDKITRPVTYFLKPS